MGGILSSTNKPIQIPIQQMGLSPDAAKFLVMPIYYTSEALSVDERESALVAWKMISSNKAPNYLAQKQADPSFPYTLCSEFFYDIFFGRLNDVHPGAQGLFSKSGQRMRQYFLASITMILSLMDDVGKFTRTLQHLAQVHNKIGVKAIEYGIVGEILLYTIKKCCGDAFNEKAHRGWAKILSRMLDVIIPVVIDFEMGNPEMVTGLSEKRSGSQRTSATPWRDSNSSTKSSDATDQMRFPDETVGLMPSSASQSTFR